MRIKTFPHGVHTPELKELSAEKPLEQVEPPDKVVIPLLQHFGKPAQALVKKGDDVLLGQKIGEASALFSANIHSSVSGKVISVDPFNHPGGNPVPSITVANDGKDRIPSERKGVEEPLSLSPEEIRQKIKEAGVVGLGGAAFPTAVKLTPPKDKSIDTIIINGCECEPLLTSDYRLMLEYPEDILMGAELACIATGATRIIVGIEDNKKNAFQVFQEKIKQYPGIEHLHLEPLTREAMLLKTKYPQGAEKNLIYALLRREVPRGGLPFDVGVVVQNVGTAKAIWDAVREGKPLYERALTVSGHGINEPKNVVARIGTSFQHLIDFCGGHNEDVNTLIMGGPMMGIAQWSLEIPVIKGTSGILALAAPRRGIEYPCIRCGRCVEHCSMGLVPAFLTKYIQYDQLAEAEKGGILDCVECGCCQYSCPAEIPLVHWMRLGKSKVISLQKNKSA